MTFPSEASETIAGHISTAEQEPVQKKCKIFCISLRRILGHLQSCSSYFRPAYHCANFKVLYKV